MCKTVAWYLEEFRRVLTHAHSQGLESLEQLCDGSSRWMKVPGLWEPSCVRCLLPDQLERGWRRWWECTGRSLLLETGPKSWKCCLLMQGSVGWPSTRCSECVLFQVLGGVTLFIKLVHALLSTCSPLMPFRNLSDLREACAA